jgi:hypothetical protein
VSCNHLAFPCIIIQTSDDSDDDFEYHEAIPNIEQIEKLVEDIDDIPPDLLSLSDNDSDFEDFVQAICPPAQVVRALVTMEQTSNKILHGVVNNEILWLCLNILRYN